jgi:hypothetical protein
LMAHSSLVAHLLPRRQHGSNFLFHLLQHHQLAEHRVSLRLCRRLARNPLCPSIGRPAPGLHQLLDSYACRELAPLWWHALLPSFVSPGHDWPDPDRARATIRSRGSNPLFKSMVHPTGSLFGDRGRIPCESFRGCPRPAHQPISCNIPFHDPEDDALRRDNHHCHCHPFVFYSGPTSYSFVAGIRSSAPLRA